MIEIDSSEGITRLSSRGSLWDSFPHFRSLSRGFKILLLRNFSPSHSGMEVYAAEVVSDLPSPVDYLYLC